MMISSDKSLTVTTGGTGCKTRPSLWIRTAAGPQIGFGHLKRCLILAQTLRDCCNPLFLVDDDDCWSKEQITDNGWNYCSQNLHDVWRLMPDPAGILIDTRLSLGLDQLISTAQQRGIPVISIHDLGLNPLPSDIIVDGSIAPLPGNKVLPAAYYCSGTEFMILDPVYNRLHQKRKRIGERIRSVFVNLGGGDSELFFLKVLAGLKLWSNEAEVIGVPGFIQWGQESLRRSESVPTNFRWAARNIERHLFQADLAITAGGIAAYEALCTGTPLLALSRDPLQQSTITALADKGACLDLGPGSQLDPRKVSATVSLMDTDAEIRKSLSIRGREVVDGRGVERVSQIIRQSIQCCSTTDDWRYDDASGAGV